MAKKISKIGNAIEIADTLSGLIENSHPAKNCWYDEKMLENSSVVKISFINNYGFKGSLKFNLSNTVDSESVAFTKETFREFARNSMGFSGGGSASLSTENAETLKHFIYNPVTDKLEADLLMQLNYFGADKVAPKSNLTVTQLKSVIKKQSLGELTFSEIIRVEQVMLNIQGGDL